MTASASKSQLAYGFIREQIVSGRFHPGHRLVLAVIANELAISVVPVREAIHRLEAERLVTCERNIGAQVAILDEHEYRHAMEALAVVEGYATALSAPHLTPDHLERARTVNTSLQRSLDDFQPSAFTEHNQEFHALLFQACSNPHILDLVHRGWARLANLRDSTFSFVPGRARESVAEHAQLLSLLETRAAAHEIEQAAREHRIRTLDAFLARESSRPIPAA